MPPALPRVEPPCRFPVRKNDAHKGDFGRVLLIGGSRGMSGSIALSSMAALKTGSGLVTAAVPDRCLESVAAFHPAIMTLPLPDEAPGTFATAASQEIQSSIHRADAVAIGPGMTTSSGSIGLVHRVLQHSGCPKIIDADAINGLSMMDWRGDPNLDLRNTIFTPHPGECERLLGASAKDRDAQVRAAKDFAIETGAIVVLKGGPTIVIAPDDSYTNTTGNPGMATAGSGDVLTGVITSLVGQGFSSIDAARLGVWLHGRAGDEAAHHFGQPATTATDILNCLAVAVQYVWALPGSDAPSSEPG